MSARSAYTDQEWQTLQFAPLAAFFAVAAADASISQLEEAELITQLTAVSMVTAPEANLSREVFGSIKDDLDEIIKRFNAALGHGLHFADMFNETKRLLDARASQSEAYWFKEFIRLLAVATAETAPLIGTKERAAIANVISLLA